MWAILLNTMSVQVPVWILTCFFSPAIVGFYAIGKRVLSMPSLLVSNAVAQVFLQRAAAVKGSSHDMHKVVENVFKRLISLGMFPFLFLAFYGSNVFTVVFGSRWAEAGVYIQILSIPIFLSFVIAPISTLFSVFEKQRSSLVFNIVFFGASITSLIVGSKTGDARLALTFFSVTRVTCYIWLCLWMFSLAGVSLKKPLWHVFRHVIYCLPILAAITLLKEFVGIKPIWVLLAGCVGTTIYYLIIFKQDSELQDFVRLSYQKLQAGTQITEENI